MSSRYEDTRTRREVRVSEDTVDDREPGQGIRRDVRQTSQNIREAGGDIVSNLCGLWSNVLTSVGDAISPQSRSTSTSNRSRAGSGTADRSGVFGCEGAEFRISCGPASGEGDGGRNSRDSRDDDDDSGTRARYADGKREIDVTT